MARAKKKKPAKPEAVTVDAVAARCPHCESSSVEVLRSLPGTDYQGFHEGRPYTRVERRRVRCRDCEHGFIRREHAYDPAVWTGRAMSPLPMESRMKPGLHAA